MPRRASDGGLGEFDAKENPIFPHYDWSSGASAQVEIVGSGKAQYTIYYVLPRRPSIRPPIRESGLTEADFERIDSQLDTVKRLLNNVEGGRSVPVESSPASPKSGGSADDVEKSLKLLGTTLFNIILPRSVRNGLLANKCFLEIGVDEELNRLPLELMHDGQNYLCLKHSIGRYVVRARA
jgi:hypothetical protein